MNWQRSGNWLKSLLEKPLGKAVAAVGGIMQQTTGKESNRIGNAVIALMKTVIWANGQPNERVISEFRDVAGKFLSPSQIKTLLDDLMVKESIDLDETTATLNEIDSEKKTDIVRMLIALAVSGNKLSDKQRQLIEHIAKLLEIDPETLQNLFDETIKTEQSRQRLIKSGAGFLVALIVIVVFILTATLLKSVIFGLILAYFFLPFEKWYEQQLTGSRFIIRILGNFGRLFKPFNKLSRLMRPLSNRRELSTDEIADRKKQLLVSRATTLTVSTAVIVLLTIGVVLFLLSASYFEGAGRAITSWVKQQNQQTSKTSTATETPATVDNDKKQLEQEKLTADMQEPVAATKSNNKNDHGLSVIRNLITELEKLKPKFEELPAVRWGINQVSMLLNDPATQREVVALVLKKTGGIFAFAAGLISLIVTLLLNTLLTFFFFSLFLNKMALFNADRGNSPDVSGYLVSTIFNGKWLPGADEASAREGQRIIEEVINKLKTWLKGYGTLVLLDMILYSSAFYLLGVPYWLPLGLIGGCGILLPYIGAVASGILTILVALAAGGDNVTMLQIVGIVGFYAFHNGVVEQFFLYPRIIGNSLGLSTLETIIVVLLGGIFAGITGMIFAIPTAAVLKYLVPQIYLLNRTEDTG